MTDRFLPGIPGEQIEGIFNNAPGNEIESGKFDSPESSAALAANAFGWFLSRARDLPPLPGCAHLTWPAASLSLEETIRFPWRGGLHPVPDVVVATESALIGIESKRFEPFRTRKPATFSEAYWRPVWGEYMQGYESVRDRLRDGYRYTHLCAAQLVKHAFALRTVVHNRNKEYHGLAPILFYIYAEPEFWPKNGRQPITKKEIAAHEQEIDHFQSSVAGDEVQFIACPYRVMLTDWKKNKEPGIRAHAAAVIERFAP